MHDGEKFYCPNDTVPGTDLYAYRIRGYFLPEAGLKNYVTCLDQRTSLTSEEIIGITSNFIPKHALITVLDGQIRRVSGDPIRPGIVGRLTGVVYHYPNHLPDGPIIDNVDSFILPDDL